MLLPSLLSALLAPPPLSLQQKQRSPSQQRKKLRFLSPPSPTPLHACLYGSVGFFVSFFVLDLVAVINFVGSLLVPDMSSLWRFDDSERCLFHFNA